MAQMWYNAVRASLCRRCTTKAEKAISNQQLQEFIGAGDGTAKQVNGDRPEKTVKFMLTLPADICADVDQLRTQGHSSVSHHRWVVEAIRMRIEQEKG